MGRWTVDRWADNGVGRQWRAGDMGANVGSSQSVAVRRSISTDTTIQRVHVQPHAATAGCRLSKQQGQPTCKSHPAIQPT